MNLILVGFKRAGKTTYGKLLAEVLKVPFIDTDDLIEEAYQKKYHEKLKTFEIHQKLGEQAFRTFEEEVVLKLKVAHFIIAVGGGTVLSPNCQKHLKSLGTFVYLKQSKADVQKALSLGRMPTFLDQNNFVDSFEKMYQKRAPIFEGLADYVLNIQGLACEDILNYLIEFSRKKAIFLDFSP